MTITTEKNPVTRKPFLLAQGKVDGVHVNELKEKKTYSGPNGPWSPTHSINLVVDGDRISLGLTDKESVRAKDTNDEYQDLVRGAEVSVIVEENGEYKGVKQYQSRTSQVTILSLPSVSETKKTSGQPFQKRDNSGMEIGHAVNGGLNLVRNGSDGDVVSISQQVHDLTVRLKEEYSKRYPDMSEYDVGASVGHAVLNGTRDSDSVDGAEEVARNILDNVVPAVSEYVRGGNKTKSSPAKKTTTSTQKKEDVSNGEPSASVNSNDFDDLDDQEVPF